MTHATSEPTVRELPEATSITGNANAAEASDKSLRPAPPLPHSTLSSARLRPSQVSALTDALDGRWAMARRQARKALGELGEPMIGMPATEQRSATLQRLKAFAAYDFPLGYPDQGQPDLGGSLSVIEQLGHSDMSIMVKAGVQWGLFGGAIAALGGPEHHASLLPRVRSLELLGCFAMTESGHGSDVANLQTTATYRPDTDEIEIHTPTPRDRKDYIGNAAEDGELAVVFAQLQVDGSEHGVHAVLVPIRDERGRPMPGVTLSDCGSKGGLNGVDNGRIAFDHVRVPRTSLLPRYGSIDGNGVYSSPVVNPKARFFTMLGTLVRARVVVGGAAGCATKSGLTIAIRYAMQRKQFDRYDGAPEVPLLDYPAHRRRLLPALATTYALHFAQLRMTEDLHEITTATDDVSARMRNLESRAAGIKALTTEHANRTLQECREACGGAGFLAENLIVQLRSDCDVFATFEGDNSVLLQLVGKGLLTGYRHHLGELDGVGVARFVAEKFVSSFLERISARSFVTGIENWRGGERELMDRRWHRELFEDRASHALDGLAQRIQSRTQRGKDAGKSKDAAQFDAFLACQVHLLDAARAEVRRGLLESFVTAIDACEDAGATALLNTVCDLYVLSEIDRDRAWYLEHGRIAPERSKQLTAMVDELCATLAPHAATLVDAFDIPDNVLSASMLSPVQ